MTDRTVWEKLEHFSPVSLKYEMHFLLLLMFSAPRRFFFYFSIRINCSSFLPVRHLLSQIASVQLEEDLENEPVKTNDPGCSQLARGKRKAVPDRQRPSLHLCFLCLTLLPTSLWDCETVTSRLQWHGEGEGAGTPLSSSIQCVWPPTYHCPNTHAPAHTPFLSVKERKTDTFMHCFQCHSYWNLSS